MEMGSLPHKKGIGSDPGGLERLGSNQQLIMSDDAQIVWKKPEGGGEMPDQWCIGKMVASVTSLRPFIHNGDFL